MPRIILSCPDHPVYEEMVEALAGSVDFAIVGPRFRGVRRGGEPAGTKQSWAQFAAALLRGMRRWPRGAVVWHRVKSLVVDRWLPAGEMLVHCCGHVLEPGRSWVGDYENVNVLGWYSPGLLKSRDLRQYLSRVLASDTCKAIRVWSDSARRSFEALLQCQAISAKLRVIYPTLARVPQAVAQAGGGDPVRVLFVGRGFHVKGGRIFLEAVRRLRRTTRFRVTFICELPREAAYYRVTLNGLVDFLEPTLPREVMIREVYPSHHIAVMLGMADSYGLTLIEAAACGLPVLVFRLNSGVADVVRLAGNALVVEPEYTIFGPDGIHLVEPRLLLARLRNESHEGAVQRVADALGRLIEDAPLRAELGSRGRWASTEGPLAPWRMRRQLLELYRDAGVVADEP